MWFDERAAPMQHSTRRASGKSYGQHGQHPQREQHHGAELIGWRQMRPRRQPPDHGSVALHDQVIGLLAVSRRVPVYPDAQSRRITATTQVDAPTIA